MPRRLPSLQPTYEGLKRFNNAADADVIRGLQPTYEGLKRLLPGWRCSGRCGLQPTYEGLKLFVALTASKPSLAFAAYL